MTLKYNGYPRIAFKVAGLMEDLVLWGSHESTNSGDVEMFVR